jgi:hypothetical protein
MAPEGGGFYSGAGMDSSTIPPSSDKRTTGDKNYGSGEEFVDLMKRFGAFCLKLFNMGLSNYLEATKGGQHLFSCPVLVVILLTIFFFWVTVPLFIISMFCGFRYRLSGRDLGKDSVNAVMDNATDVVEDVKKTFVDSFSKKDDQ